MRGEEDQASKFLYELCSALFAVVRSSQLTAPPSSSSRYGVRVGSAEMPHATPQLPRRLSWPQASPAAVASLMLVVAMSLMLGGSITFMLGFLMMPWVLGMLTLFYLAGIISSLSGLGRAILFPSAPKEVKDHCGGRETKPPVTVSWQHSESSHSSKEFWKSELWEI